MAEPSPLLFWAGDFSIRSFGGYRENILRSSTNHASAPFLGFGADLTLFHVPVDENSFQLAFSADERRYIPPVSPGPGEPLARNDQLFVTQAAYKWYGSERWLPAITVTHLYADEVFDASTVDQAQSVRAQENQVSVLPSLRLDLPFKLRVQGGYQWQRTFFSEPLDSYWENGPTATIGWDYTTNSLVEGSYLYFDRQYDSRLAADFFGNGLLGTVAHFSGHRVELTWKHEWASAPQIRTTVRPFYVRNVDLEDGWYTYGQLGIAGAADISWKRLTLRAAAHWSTYVYDFQFASLAKPLEQRVEEEYSVTGRVEYRLFSQLSVFGETGLERARSNLSVAAYRSWVGLGGVQWRF